MERLALFLDHANLQGSFRDLKTQVDYRGLRDYLSDGRFLVDAFVYVPIHPTHPEKILRFIEFLRREGFFVRPKNGKPTSNGGWKCNVDIEIAIDMLRVTHESKVDIVVLGSGDGDMTPIVDEVRYKGVRCEVASTPGSVAKELRLAASGFIDLETVIQGQPPPGEVENGQTEEGAYGPGLYQAPDDSDGRNTEKTQDGGDSGAISSIQF